VSVPDVIERALALVHDKLQTQNVEVITMFEDAGGYVYGDRDELTQVFINLINNAADAMPDLGRLSLSSEICRTRTSVTSRPG
jgi:C4-dicarboxylate-specific signal transduction histidine kinase